MNEVYHILCDVQGLFNLFEFPLLMKVSSPAMSNLGWLFYLRYINVEFYREAGNAAAPAARGR